MAYVTERVRLLESEQINIRRLFEGCLRNDRGSQKLLYKEFYSYGMSVCLRYSDSRDEAVELLNDGFMKIFNSLHKFDLSKPFKPWFRKILVNLAINRYHEKQRQIETEEMDDSHDDSDDEKIISAISYQEAIALLQKLPPAYRTVFNLHVIEGYSHEEIATMLNISVGTSKSNLFKAKEHLKKILADFFEMDDVRTR